MISLFHAGPKTLGLDSLQGFLAGSGGIELCLMLREEARPAQYSLQEGVKNDR
jgi:hypothetical protein